MKCPSPDALLVFALDRPEQVSISAHASECAECRAKVNQLRDSVGALHAETGSIPSAEHVSDDTIALLADGETSSIASDDIVHVADCAECRSRLSTVSGILEDDSVKSELRALEPMLPRRRSSRTILPYVGGLAAAAAAAIVLLGPMRARNTEPVHRETAITTTAAPRILSPARLSLPGDSLRWTSLPQADLYRIRIWDTEGTVVSTVDTRDTTVAVPSEIQEGVQYMWEIKARTGWDRWVSSDLVELTLRSR
jgi:hypothetical protein